MLLPHGSEEKTIDRVSAGRSPGKGFGEPITLLLLISLLLAACGPALPTTVPTAPLPPPPTRAPVTQTPLPTELPTPTATPTATPTVTPSPTPTPSPSPPLGLARLWAWTARDIINAFLVQDFDGDGQTEIALGSFDRQVYLVNAKGETLWAYDTGGSVFCLAAADLTGDGRDEILAGSANGSLLAFSAAGDLLWQTALAGRVTAITAVDLDVDARREILAGTRPQGAWLLQREGSILWQQDTLGAPTAFFEFGGVHNRMIVLSTEEGAVQGLDLAGVPLWQHEGAGYVRGLALLEGGVVAGARDGSLRQFTWYGHPALETVLSGPVPTVVTFDLNDDGQPEILAGVAGEKNALVALDLSGDPLWSTPTERGVWSFAFPDLEGNGRPDIVAGTDGGEIIILDLSGQPRGHTWVPFRVHGLLAADLDGDGRDELLARASNHLYAFAGDAMGEEGERQPLVETSARWPEDTPLLSPEEGQIVLVAVGDIMLGRAVEPRMLMYGASFPFAALLPVLSQADITTGNLEGVLAHSGTPLRKSFTFRAHPSLISGLQEAGFDLLTLANNHALDFGQAGLEETLAVLRQAGIEPVGAGPDAYEAVLVEVKGLRLAFLGRTVAIAPQEGAAWGGEDELRQAVAAARQQADLVVVHLHAGIEYLTTSDETQRRLARAAAEGGAALVIGHHPHALQEVEWIGQTLVAYSLGDFVFDIDDHDVARDAVVLRVLLSREGVEGVEWIPARIIDDVQPQPLAGDDGRPQVQVMYP